MNSIRQIRMDCKLTVSVEDAAELIGLGSAALKQESLTPYTGNSAENYEGRALAILRRNGEGERISVTISIEGLDDVCMEI